MKTPMRFCIINTEINSLFTLHLHFHSAAHILHLRFLEHRFSRMISDIDIYAILLPELSVFQLVTRNFLN